jgi:hypothetical protein
MSLISTSFASHLKGNHYFKKDVEVLAGGVIFEIYRKVYTFFLMVPHSLTYEDIKIL